jgi:hypothetical protein
MTPDEVYAAYKRLVEDFNTVKLATLSPEDRLLTMFTDAVERVAREIPAPSHQASQLFSMVVAARNELSRRQAQSSQPARPSHVDK